VYESYFIEIMPTKGKKIVIGSVYRPNSSYVDITSAEQLSIFNDSLLSVLLSINDCKSNAYILGDINLDVLKMCNHGPTADYVENIFSMGYLQLITKPTRCTGASATLIDHILTNELKNDYESGIITNRISDHFPIFHIISGQKAKISHSTVYRRDFSDANVEQFNFNLRAVGWHEVLENQDPQASTDLFYSTFLDLFNLHFPLKKHRFNKNFDTKEKWMTRGLMVSRATKLKLCNSSICDPSGTNISAYKTYRNLYKKLLRLMKKILL